MYVRSSPVMSVRLAMRASEEESTKLNHNRYQNIVDFSRKAIKEKSLLHITGINN